VDVYTGAEHDGVQTHTKSAEFGVAANLYTKGGVVQTDIFLTQGESGGKDFYIGTFSHKDLEEDSIVITRRVPKDPAAEMQKQKEMQMAMGPNRFWDLQGAQDAKEAGTETTE